MAETLLSNPVIETYTVRVEDHVRIGVVTFPGSLDDSDALRAVSVAGARGGGAMARATPTCTGSTPSCCPGGFSYGDYLRCGAIARFAPVMTEVVAAAERGMPVLGICNGFQILCESHLLPGALIRNDHRTFVCRDQRLRIETHEHLLDVRVRARGRRSRSRSRTARAGTSQPRRPWTSSRARAGSSLATSTSTPTGRCATSRASATSGATWSA